MTQEIKTGIYPALGSKVRFVRQHNLDVIGGTGRIVALVLDPNKRIMATIEDDEKIVTEGEDRNQRYNVHLTCLNPDDDFIGKFTQAMAEVNLIGDEGNAKIKEVATEYNNMVNDVQAQVLGDVVEFND